MRPPPRRRPPLTWPAIENLFRVIVVFQPPAPISAPRWYHKSAMFYCFVPAIEILVVVLYAASRADQRFFVVSTSPSLDEAGEVLRDEEKSAKGSADVRENADV